MDACLTTIEIVSLIQNHLSEEKSFFDYGAQNVELDTLTGEKISFQVLHGVPGGSGGLLEYIYRIAARRLFGIDIPDGPLPMKILRNTNFKVPFLSFLSVCLSLNAFRRLSLKMKWGAR